MRHLRAALAVTCLVRGSAPAVAPPSHDHDIVAGEGVEGYRDGTFLKARFTFPSALAANPNGRELYVAEAVANRVRVIHLTEGNRVDSLVGNPRGTLGTGDGPLADARLEGPAALATAGEAVLYVGQMSGAPLRRIDLKGRTVTSVPSIPAGGVSGLAYSAKGHALYFAQPEEGAVRSLDVVTGTVSTLVQASKHLPHPTAVCLRNDEIYVADRSGLVVRVTAPGIVVDIVRGRKIVSLAVSGDQLYGLENDSRTPWLRLDPPVRPVRALSTSGAELTNPQDPGAHLRPWVWGPVALAADPRGERALFYALPHLILSLHDYRFDEESRSGLTDFDYPTKKPANTYRILLVGDSHVLLETPTEMKAHAGTPVRSELVAKRLELFVATEAAIQGSPRRYEVLTSARYSWEPLLVWPAYTVPKLVKDFEIDHVLFAVAGQENSLLAYLDRPTTAGLPIDHVDPEYELRPWRDKVARSPARAIFERCLKLKLARAVTETHIELAPLGELVADPGVHQLLLDLYAKPLGRLRGRIARNVPVDVCFVPPGRRYMAESERAFLRELAARVDCRYVDVTETFATLRETYFPVSEMTALDHFTATGHALYAYLLARELLGRKLVPLF